MEFSVDLQDPFLFPPIWIVCAILFAVAAIATVFLLYHFLRGKVSLENPLEGLHDLHIRPVSASHLSRLKTQYQKKLQHLSDRQKTGKVSERKAYQEMSRLIRDFVKDATGIQVTTCTYTDIKALNLPALTKLLHTYYEPEFAERSNANFEKSLKDTLEIIKKWN
ncbi:MAG TPA: hypothetical protein DCS54_05985 [Oribacterium sp.]|jgi:hypothetical protein|nr:hypothetical protein [Oribacterium sp.]